jgi:hypothetical protein
VVVFATAVLGLAYLVRRRRPAAGLIGGALGLAGLFGLAFVDALDGYTWAILGEVSARPDVDAGSWPPRSCPWAERPWRRRSGSCPTTRSRAAAGRRP